MKKDKKESNEKIVITIDKRKILKGLGIFAVIIAILGISFVTSKSYGNDDTSYEFINITIDEYLEKIQSQEKQIFYIARPGCSYCVKETPILKKIASKYNLEVYYLDTTDFYDSVNEEYTENGLKFINSDEKYKNGYGTPNTIIVQNGKIIDGVFQYVESRELVNLFKNNGMING